MLLHSDLAEMLGKYSFIHKVTTTPGTFSIYYIVNGEERVRKVTRRATVSQVMLIVKGIEKEVVKTPFGKGLRDDMLIVGVGE